MFDDFDTQVQCEETDYAVISAELLEEIYED